MSEAFIRHPRTTQEGRRWYADTEHARPRGARSPKHNRNLPSAWDDIARRPQRCWKYQGRMKYRVVAG